MTDGVGAWGGNEGKPVLEPVRTLTSAHNCASAKHCKRVLSTRGIETSAAVPPPARAGGWWLGRGEWAMAARRAP